MVLHLFAGIRVRDHAAAVPWYVRLFGAEPVMVPHDTESVWQLDERCLVYVVESAEHAGHSVVTVFVDDLDERVAGIAARGIEPAGRETYGDGVRKVTYRDADGNEVGFGGGPG